ncbi:hypothetical protein MLD38_013478 [Melastoma candidum]|uniref:Uncharacterized protein n=1 Tax=Melastoma candidum TaxID=119954 RepID=A0ACB9R9P3_9MYRT|nr:hypothetical protein MLD38_013478 [Melastoma candidum]
MEIGIVGLLRAAWLAGTFPLIVASLPFPGLRWIHERVMGFALRGKTMQTSTRFTVPQRLFSHFYLVAVLWTSLLLGSIWIYAHNEEPLALKPFSYSAITEHLTGGSHLFSFHKSRSPSLKHRYNVWKSVFLLLLMEIQVSRRLFESINVFNYSPSARMHIMGYLTGIFFYTAAPLSLCCNILPDVLTYWKDLTSEFIVRGKAQMPPADYNIWEFVVPLTKLGWRQWIGTVIFLWGWIHQHRCHKILGSLRENREQREEYVVPRGDWFEIVSCPHYLAEIVIYFGLFVASGASDITVFLVLVFVVANLTFAAAETHRWYKRKFEEYPERRHAIIPFVC